MTTYTDGRRCKKMHHWAYEGRIRCCLRCGLYEENFIDPALPENPVRPLREYCRRGHKMTLDNVKRAGGYDRCITCDAISRRVVRERRETKKKGVTCTK